MKKIELKINEKDILKYTECGINAALARNLEKREEIFSNINHALAASSKEQLRKNFRDLKEADKDFAEELENLNSLIEHLEIVEPLSSDT